MKKVENNKLDKVSLNIKVSPELDLMLKIFREAARLEGKKFNVSDLTEGYLMRTLKKMEKDNVFMKKSISEAKKKVEEKAKKTKMQRGMFVEKNGKLVAKKVENKVDS